MKPDPCWCGDYTFPHRLLGGRCRGGPNEEAVPQGDKGLTADDFAGDDPHADDKYNDPRRGEAAAINARRCF